MAEQPIFGITNIPQDIKLELNNGTLTLSSGSILTFADGSQYQLASNKTSTNGWGGANEEQLIFYRKGTSSLYIFPKAYCFSGTTAPTSFLASLRAIWYDTTNSIIKWTGDAGVTWVDEFSLPLGIIRETSGNVYSSLDQVFNGFGYIGSSIFVLPGVEGYYPDGKDRFLIKYGTRTTNSVLIYNNTAAHTNTPIAFSTTVYNWGYGYEVVDSLPDVSQMTIWKRYYVKRDNKVYYTSNGSSITKGNEVPFGYISTESSSPYKISNLTIVNPFLKLAFRTVSDYAKYLANLLIIQYNNKPKATQTIESLGGMFPDELILSVRDGFDLETATGSQLDILAKYIGASRGYTDSNSQKAVLTDEEFRVLLMLKTIVNNGNATLAGIENSLYNLFKTGIRVVENKDSGGNQTRSLTYYIRSDWSNVGLAAVQQDILPHPMGISATYNLAAQVKYFGFVEYSDLSHPYSTGFRDYNNPTKQGEMYSYDKVIS